VTGIEPAFQAWEACVLPLNYTRNIRHIMPRPRPLRNPVSTTTARPDGCVGSDCFEIVCGPTSHPERVGHEWSSESASGGRVHCVAIQPLRAELGLIDAIGNPTYRQNPMFRRRRERQDQQGLVNGNTFLAAGWIEGALMTAKEGAFQAYGWMTGPGNGVDFFPTDGSIANVSYPFSVIDWVEVEPRSELDEAVIAHHAQLFSVCDSPTHLVGCFTRPNAPSSELFVLLPMMEGTSEEWIELFKQAGVKVQLTVVWLRWDTSAWPEDQRDRLAATLNDYEVPHRWKDAVLESAKQIELAMLGVFSKLGIDASPT
jgi:hypothetical protein